MKASLQKEILLITSTHFLSQQYCERDDNGNDKPLNDLEHLQHACWNGLMKELLPEIFKYDNPDQPLFVWQVRLANSFIEMDMSPADEPVVSFTSIDPYLFLCTQHYN